MFDEQTPAGAIAQKVSEVAEARGLPNGPGRFGLDAVQTGHHRPDCGRRQTPVGGAAQAALLTGLEFIAHPLWALPVPEQVGG